MRPLKFATKKNLLSLLFIVALVVSINPPAIYATLGKPASKEHSTNFYRVPAGLRTQVDFWVKVYSKYTTNQVVIHDGKNLALVYEVINLKGKSERAKKRLTKKIKRKYKKILRKLARLKAPGKLSREERRVRNLVKGNFRLASKRVRAQLGQADRFKQGIERSGRYFSEMEKIFKRHGLPTDLLVLPHVESSFMVGAYSKFGASGIWQFTRSTGRLFMQVDYMVDERRDPLISTDAAARLLKKNYEELGSWPLAVTAYNHGLSGMKRAKKKLGSDLATIIRKYKSRTFGFASRNFYCEFLAALQVVRDQKKYFPNLKRHGALAFDTLPLDHFFDFKTLARQFNISADELAGLNPALRPSVTGGEKRVPKGIRLKVPRGTGKKLLVKLSSIPVHLKFQKQKHSKWYRVRRGDTLSGIAKRYKTTVAGLCRLNHISWRKRIYLGQVLRLPSTSAGGVTRVAARAPERKHKGRKSLSAFTYRVRKNDNISSIAKTHGMKVAELLRLNGLRKKGVIYPNQLLRLAKSSPAPSQKKASREQPANVSVAAREIASKPGLAMAPISGLKLRGREGVITVENNETLGHYSEWSGLSARDIRRLNRLPFRRKIKVGDKIKVVLKKVTPEEFEERRREYHYGIRQDFYSSYEIIRLEVIKVRPGQSLWEICRKTYDIPYWLVKDFNPTLDITRLMPGQLIKIPIVNSISGNIPT